jgi:hypothetical protein
MDNKIQPLPLGIALGASWAFYVFCLAIMAMFHWGTDIVAALGSLYLGYSASILGAFIGAVWAFFDGLVAGVVLAWLYNVIAT